MGIVVSSDAGDAVLGDERSGRRRRSHAPRHAASSGDRTSRRGVLRRTASAVRAYLPRGNTLDEATFQRRHLFLCWVLGLHVPGLFALGVWRGYAPAHLALELTVPLACVAFGRLAINRRLAAFFVTAGLVYCSVVLVHLTAGAIEAHFHFFILIGLIALYQDWVPFLWNVVFTVLSHGLGSAIGSKLMFNHDAAQSRPWTWAALHGIAVLAACVGEIIFWKNTEQEQERNVTLVADLAAADAERREAMSELLVNLARRNQSLLNRQLEVITDLELREREPDVLEELFRLDHLATRIRRNAESLLVLSGDEPSRRWGTAVPLGDVVRAAAAEVEDYRRVEVLVNDHIEVAGRAVADLAHLLAELIENATTFSPPSSDVRVRSQLSASYPIATVVSIEDVGIGMSDDDLRTANALLVDAPEVDLRRSTMLGFHVVARLARRYGIGVQLASTPGGGVTAMVTLPAELVSERTVSGRPATVGADAGPDRYRRAALASRGRADVGGPPWLEGVAVRSDPGARTARANAVDTAALADGAARWREVETVSLEPFRPTPTPPPALPPPSVVAPVAPAAWWWESERLVRRSEPDAVVPAAADDGLVRRVPGANLAPALRRGAPLDGATPATAQPLGRDRQHVRSMLSKFQANQRAGRAATGALPADPPQEDR